MRKSLYNMSGGRGYQPGDNNKTQVSEKVFSVKTRNGNFAVERFIDRYGVESYRLMHDRRYITPELFKKENTAIAVLLEHLSRDFVRHLALFLVDQQSKEDFVDDGFTLLENR